MIRRAEKSRQPLRVRGVIRYWPEHAIGLPHRQGEALERLPNANPDHVFELHPVVRLEDLDLMATLRTVRGYRPGHAATVLAQWEETTIQVMVRPDSVLIETPAGLRNDVHFLLELADAAPLEVEDGRFLRGRARDLEGKLLLDSVRVVLIEDSPPERAIRALPARTWLHVWALPRVSLAGLLGLVEAAGPDSTARAGKLPYELLILGIYPEGQ
jgi:hypothetical protein